VSAERIEDLVARFLDRREGEPALAPERFAADLGPLREPVLAAIGRALDFERALHDGAPAAPREIAGYRIVREIGRGGMGAVYEAEKQGARFALKLLHPACVSAPSAMQRFVREASALARVRHASVVALRDHGVAGGEPYLAMDFVEGRALSDVAERTEPRRAAWIVRELASAVAALHEAGIVHRDIKPHNVIVRGDGTPVLVDLGLASLAGDDTLTASGAVLGTPRYMAPEQARGEAPDERTDVFALGLILYELLCGRPARAEGSRERVLADVARGSVPPPRRWTRGLDRGLERILASALAWNRARRMPSARALADDLGRFLAGEPVRAHAPSRVARAVDAMRREPRTAATVTLAVALAAVAGWSAWSSFGPGSRARAHEAERSVDAALAAWLQGTEAVARAEVERARRSRASGRSLDLARALVDRDPAVAPLRDRALVEAWLRGDFAAAAELAAPGAGGDSADPGRDAVHAEALRRSMQAERAVAEARNARLRWPGSAAIACVLASALADEGDAAGAVTAARDAVALLPRSAPLHAQLARSLASASDVAGAVESALTAAELYRLDGVAGETELARLLAGAPEVAGVASELERRVAAEPGLALAWFALGWLRDDEHALARAADAYARAADSDPGLVRARTNLAHLYAGAQRGSCKRCDAAFAEAPQMFAPERALEELTAALRADRGASDWATGRIVQTALDLAQRAPHVQAPQRIHAVVGELARDPTLAPASRARLDEALARLRGAL
jgi:predicted Ser/Thr protein kinase